MVVISNIIVENAKIGFRNFSGEAGMYNPKGRRNFCVFFDPVFGERLASHGWNIKWLSAKEEGEPDTPYLQVTVAFENYPPKIIQVTTGGQTLLTEETVHVLDWADILHVDLEIRPYQWEVNDKSGIKAYLRTMYITIQEDVFAEKYRDDI